MHPGVIFLFSIENSESSEIKSNRSFNIFKPNDLCPLLRFSVSFKPRPSSVTVITRVFSGSIASKWTLTFDCSVSLIPC